jgi:hypothetical protein
MNLINRDILPHTARNPSLRLFDSITVFSWRGGGGGGGGWGGGGGGLMKRADRNALLLHVQQHLPALGVTEIDLFRDRQVHVVADWYREHGHTRIRLLKSAQGRVELGVTDDPRGVARDAVVTSFTPRDSQGRKHGWHTTWYGYLHRIHSERLYAHGVLLQEHRFDDGCDGNQTKLALWDAETAHLNVRATCNHLLTRREDGSYDRKSCAFDTVFDHFLTYEKAPNEAHQEALALVLQPELERVVGEWLLAAEAEEKARTPSSQPSVALAANGAPAAIVVMHMKRGTFPVVCLGRALDAIRDLERSGIIASTPEPVLADWNTYPLQPQQAPELVLAIHRIGADRQPGKLITRVDIA